MRGWFLAVLLGLLAPSWAAAGALPEVLVDTEWLQAHLNDPSVRIIEVSVNVGQYGRGHIPGAVELVWHTDLVDPVRRDIASRENLQERLREAGVSTSSTIVLYGDNHNWFAAWGAWVLDIYGVQRVRLLDGGRGKWEAEGRPLVRNSPAPARGDIALGPADPSLRAWLADAVAVAEGRSRETLVDIRSPEEFSGELFAPPGFQESALRAGHIPGAINVPWTRAVNPDGTFKPVEELRKLYAEAGIDGSRPIITYCRIGERASHTWFALSKLLGYEVRNYDGSWTEYGNAVGVPVNNPSGRIWTGQ